MTCPFSGTSVAVTSTPEPDCVELVTALSVIVGRGGTTHDAPPPVVVTDRLASICRIMSRWSLSFCLSDGPSCAEIFVYCPTTASRIDLSSVFEAGIELAGWPTPAKMRLNAATALTWGAIGFFDPAMLMILAAYAVSPAERPEIDHPDEYSRDLN